MGVDLEHIDKLEKNAKPGPWDYFLAHHGSISFIQAPDRTTVADEVDFASGAFIGELRNAYPSLSAELRDLREKVTFWGDARIGFPPREPRKTK